MHPPFLTWGIMTISPIFSPDVIITDDDPGSASPPHPAPSTDRTTTPIFDSRESDGGVRFPSRARPDAQSHRRCVCTSQLAPSSSYHHGLAPNTPNATGQYRAMTSMLAQPRQRFPPLSTTSQPRPPHFRVLHHCASPFHHCSLTLTSFESIEITRTSYSVC